MIHRTSLPILLLTLLFVHHTAAMTDSDLRTISVSGTAMTRDLPDTIVWNVSLSETDLDLLKAKRGVMEL